MKRRTMLILGLVPALVTSLAIPVLAQEDDGAAEKTRLDGFPPAWIDLSIEELKFEVETRADRAAERVENSVWLSDEKKEDALEAIDGLLAALDDAGTNAEVAGLVVSRTQLERQERRAERRGETVDYESHLAGDFERAERRLDRLEKVTGWAGTAGEETEAIDGYLDEGAGWLAVAIGDGDIIERHDAVHIALAWMTEAAAALDDL